MKVKYLISPKISWDTLQHPKKISGSKWLIGWMDGFMDGRIVTDTYKDMPHLILCTASPPGGAITHLQNTQR